MGLFDFFSGKKVSEGSLKKHAARVADKRAQAPDRWDSILALGKMIAEAKPKPAKGSDKPAPPDPEAVVLAPRVVEALLVRYGFYVDPSITDQEEKEEAARYVVDAGELAVPPVCAFLRRSESIGWPLRLLERLVPGERVVGELLEVLAAMDTEYERDPQRKIQVLQALEDRRDPRIVEVVGRFLEDVNETARFHAIGAVLAQENAASARDALVATLAREDSVRGRARIVEGLAERGWAVGAEHREKVAKALPAGYAIDKDGLLKKR